MMWEPALNPEDLARFFVVRANAGDLDGLVALYEPDALLAGPIELRVALTTSDSERLVKFYIEAKLTSNLWK